MVNIVRMVSRNTPVIIEVVPNVDKYTVMSDGGVKLTDTDNIFMADVSFNVREGKGYIEGLFRGRVNPAHKDVGYPVTFDGDKGQFVRTDTQETVESCGLVTIYGNKIRAMLNKQ